MRIKTKGKSPTEIIIEQETMDEDKNSLALKRMDNLERKIDSQYSEFKSFVSKLDSLETSIKNIPRQKSDDKVVETGMNLDKAFNTLFVKMQELVKKSRPSMIPSPS